MNRKLTDEYDKIRTDLEEKKAVLIAELKTLSGLSANAVERTFARDIAFNENDFYGAIERLRTNVAATRKSKLRHVLYQTIFEDRVVKMIEGAGFQAKLADYMKNYEDLIRGSRFFQMGVFNHDNAGEIADNLAENGFFDARHSINMMSKTGKNDPPIETKETLIEVIQAEKAKILSDPKLLKAFEAVNDKLIKNEATRNFRALLEVNPAILPELKNLPQLRDKLWTDYLIEKLEVFQAFINVYDETKGAMWQCDRGSWGNCGRLILYHNNLLEWDGLAGSFNQQLCNDGIAYP